MPYKKRLGLALVAAGVLVLGAGYVLLGEGSMVLAPILILGSFGLFFLGIFFGWD